MSKEITTFIGGSKSLNVVGDYCYAYSGADHTEGAATEKTYLLFHTADKVIKGKFDWGYQALNNNENTTMKIYFNNVQVFQMEKEGSELQYNLENDMIIPPLTEVKITLQTTQSGNPNILLSLQKDIWINQP